MYIYVCRVFKNIKNIFSKRLHVFLHQLILFITHLKKFFLLYRTVTLKLSL